MIAQMTKEQLSEAINENGTYEEFYQKGDQHGNGKDNYMFSYHKALRLKLKAEFDRRFN